jgi:hypothetical protein
VLVVLDAGVFVSAAITPGGVAGRIVAAGFEGRFEYLLCPRLVGELMDVLGRPKSEGLPVAARRSPRWATPRMLTGERGLPDQWRTLHWVQLTHSQMRSESVREIHREIHPADKPGP